MDPKLSNLDPKLQDAYNRVMGSSTAGTNPPPPVANIQSPTFTPPPPPIQQPFNSPVTGFAPASESIQSSVPPPAPAPLNVPTPAPVYTQAPPPTPAEITPPPPPAPPAPMAPIEPAPSQSTSPSGAIPGINSTLAFNASNSDKNIGTTPVKKGGIHILPIVIGLGIIILLVAYTIAWVILFNVQIPIPGL